MAKKKINFLGTNNNKISAELDTPDNIETKFIALYAPCFTCTKNLRAIKYISSALNSKGIALFRFDFPGLGESEGDFTKTNFSTNLENLRLAYKYLEDNYTAPKLLLGHSLGGAAMMRLTMELPKVEATTIIAAPDIPSHLAEKLQKNKIEAELTGSSKKVIGGVEFELTKQFFEDLLYNDNFHNLKAITKPVLVMYSPDDDTISLEHTIRNFTEVSGLKSYVALNNVGHLMMKPDDTTKVGNIIAEWALMYIK